MTLDPNDIALIEKYLDGELSQEETHVFEEKQESSAEFREAVVFHRQLLAHLEAQQKLKLKAELQDMMIAKEEPRSFNWKLFSIAASVLLVVGFFGILQRGPSRSQELFNQYFDPYPVLSVVRGNTPNGLNPLHLYAEGKYEQFIAAITHERADYKIRTAKVQLAYGNALLAISKPEEAIEVLSQITPDQDHYLDAKWYIALGHLRLQQYEESGVLLKELMEKQSFYGSSARKLLGSIEAAED